MKFIMMMTYIHDDSDNHVIKTAYDGHYYTGYKKLTPSSTTQRCLPDSSSQPKYYKDKLSD